MRTILIDILNDKVLQLLRELESLKLIRLRSNKPDEMRPKKDWSKYKGAMTKQPLAEVDRQLKTLRNEWE